MSLSFDHQSSSFDPEKGTEVSLVWTTSGSSAEHVPRTIALENEESPQPNKFLKWTNKVEHMFGMEARGIHRVEESEQTAKTTLSFIQIAILWFSINTASQNIMIATVGREIYGLGFLDSVLCSIFGAFVGCISVAYTATWGPISGNRTLVGQFCPGKVCGLQFGSLQERYHTIDSVTLKRNPQAKLTKFRYLLDSLWAGCP